MIPPMPTIAAAMPPTRAPLDAAPVEAAVVDALAETECVVLEDVSDLVTTTVAISVVV